MGKMQRNKGARFERWLVHAFNEALPGKWKRGFQCRGGGEEVPDLDGPLLHIEAKHQIKPNIRSALAQATEDSADSGKLPVAITKENMCKPIVSMHLKDWLLMAQPYLEANDGSID